MNPATKGLIQCLVGRVLGRVSARMGRRFFGSQLGLCLRLVLSLAILFVDSFGFAQTPRSGSGSQIIQGQSYFKSCDGMLEAVETERLEQFFIGQVQSQAQALKLLADYGLVYSTDFTVALIATLESHGVHHPGIKVSDNPRAFQGFAEGVLRIADLSDEDFGAFVREVLVNLKKTVDTSSDPTPLTQIQSLVVSRIIDAVLNSGSIHLEPMFALVVRTAILNTVHDPMFGGVLKAALLSKIRGRIATGFIFFNLCSAAGCILPSAFGVSHGVGNSVAVASGVGSLLSLPSLLIVQSLIDNWVRRKTPTSTSPFGASLQTQMDDLSVIEEVRSLFKESKSSLNDVVVSLGQACSAISLCQFNPIQLAYLGHLEMEQMRAMDLALQSSLRTLNMNQKLSTLREAATQLRANPESRNLQILVHQTLLWTVESSELLESIAYDDLSTLEAKMRETKRQIMQLRDRVFRISPDDTGFDMPLKKQLIIAKLETDLATLTSVESGREQIRHRFEDLKGLLRGLSAVDFANLHSSDEWRDTASQILVILDQVPTSRGAVQ
jgi:hypothetical protein